MLLAEITREQVKERFDSLPENLRKAYLSPGISEEIRRIAQLNHLSREKTAILARVVGDVFLGFIDIDDAASAIRDNVNLPPELASSLARELRRKIFSFYEADIIKAYSPIGEGVPLIEKAAGVPAKIAPKEEVPAKGIPPIKISGEVPALKPMAQAIPPSEVKIMPPAAITGEIRPTKIEPPTATKTAPFVLHKEEKVTPLTGGTKTIQPFEARVEALAPKEEAKPLVSAELELGEEVPLFGIKKEEAPLAKTPVSAPRTVHYSDFRTPVNPFEAKAPPAQKEPAQSAPALEPSPKGNVLPQSPELWPKVQESTPPSLRITPSPQVKVEGNVVDLRQQQ